MSFDDVIFSFWGSVEAVLGASLCSLFQRNGLCRLRTIIYAGKLQRLQKPGALNRPRHPHDIPLVVLVAYYRMSAREARRRLHIAALRTPSLIHPHCGSHRSIILWSHWVVAKVLLVPPLLRRVQEWFIETAFFSSGRWQLQQVRLQRDLIMLNLAGKRIEMLVARSWPRLVWKAKRRIHWLQIIVLGALLSSIGGLLPAAWLIQIQDGCALRWNRWGRDAGELRPALSQSVSRFSLREVLWLWIVNSVLHIEQCQLLLPYVGHGVFLWHLLSLRCVLLLILSFLNVKVRGNHPSRHFSARFIILRNKWLSFFEIYWLASWVCFLFQEFVLASGNVQRAPTIIHLRLTCFLVCLFSYGPEFWQLRHRWAGRQLWFECMVVSPLMIRNSSWGKRRPARECFVLRWLLVLFGTSIHIYICRCYISFSLIHIVNASR